MNDLLGVCVFVAVIVGLGFTGDEHGIQSF